MPDLLEEAKRLSVAKWINPKSQGICLLTDEAVAARKLIPELVERLEQERDENDKLRGEVRMLRGEPALAAQQREVEDG